MVRNLEVKKPFKIIQFFLSTHKVEIVEFNTTGGETDSKLIYVQSIPDGAVPYL